MYQTKRNTNHQKLRRTLVQKVKLFNMKNILTPKEVTITQMALSGMIEDMEAVSKDTSLPFTPEARKDQKEMLACAKSALAKIAKSSGQLIQLDPYNKGDETEFLTKES